MNLIDSQTLHIVGSSGWFPVVEFGAISFVIILIYISIHTAFTNMKPATKMLVSMFLGTAAYSLAKLSIVVLFMEPVIYDF